MKQFHIPAILKCFSFPSDKGPVLDAPPCGLCRLITFSKIFPNQTSYMKVICIDGLMNN